MQKLIDLSRKNERLVAGIMSGTSVDGVDIVLLKITGSGTETNINQIGFIEYPFPEGMRELILRNSVKESSSVEDICRLNFIIAKVYASGLKCLCEELKIPISSIDLIGSHGQTIHHLPVKNIMFGYESASTLQIGDPTVLAKLSGIITVGDFRTGDLALGGEGAPLVPYFDYIMFRSAEFNRLLLNIGGISNFTVIKKNALREDLYAFDTGPGNMIIDMLMNKFYNQKYDKDGNIASAGKVNPALFEYLKEKDSFIEKYPPKSTGREMYGEAFLKNLIQNFKEINKEDFVSTLSYFTAYSVYRNYEKFVMPEIKIDQLIVSGGGAKNKFIITSLQDFFGAEINISTTDNFGISSDAKEAICFAVLANETINGQAANMPRVTGADRETILGKICLP